MAMPPNNYGDDNGNGKGKKQKGNGDMPDGFEKIPKKPVARPFEPVEKTKLETKRRKNIEYGPAPLKYENKLTLREQKFVEILLANPTVSHVRAAVEAGFPEAKAEMYAKLLVRKKNIKKALSEYREVVQEELLIDQARVLQEQTRIAFSDIRKFPGCPEGIPDDLAPAIASLEIVETTQVSKHGAEFNTKKTKITLWPKTSALESLMRHLGMYEKDNVQQGKTEVQFNTQINLAGFSREELETLVKLGLKMGSGCNLALPEKV